MPVANPVQFAVVREDPVVELSLLADVRRGASTAALLIASGGCTALTVAAARPDVALTLLDANPAQLALVERKRAALAAHAPGSAARRRTFGVDADDAASLSGCGNFESLFRGLRAVLDDLVMPAAERRALLAGDGGAGALTGNRYWPVAFEMFFSDAMLEAMFGPEATQHADKGSYPAYFRRVVERALAGGAGGAPARANPYLHHVLLGHYLDGALPAFLERMTCAQAEGARFNLVEGSVTRGPSFSAFDLVSLSNLFDWMSDDDVAATCARLAAESKPGAVVVLRQLNNRAPVERFFGDAFRFDDARAAALLARDRSMFYERLVVGTRVAGGGGA